MGEAGGGGGLGEASRYGAVLSKDSLPLLTGDRTDLGEARGRLRVS